MTRHINADKVIEEVNRISGHNLCDWSTLGVKALIDRQPTADVVPKSEYNAVVEENESLGIELENMRRNLGDAREGWNDAECEVERLRKALDAYEETSGLKQAKAEVAREIFEEIEKFMYRYLNDADYSGGDMIYDLAELKKKWEGER